jgi:hypothetical protein
MLLALGIVAWITTQAFFNIGGITRTIPLTGIPLPFISFGSSALVSTLAGAGLLVSVSRFSLQDEPRESTRHRRKRDYVGRRLLRRSANDEPPPDAPAHGEWDEEAVS